VKNRFQSLPFKYTTCAATPWSPRWGLCKLNPVVTQRLKAPGFKVWVFKFNLYRYTTLNFTIPLFTLVMVGLGCL
jgi:hypothetical protein